MKQKKYRILTNGNEYRAQYYSGFILWSEVEWDNWLDSPVKYLSKDAAISAIEQHKIYSKKQVWEILKGESE